MIKITKQELLKIAQSTAVQLYDNEVEPLIGQLEAVLTYAERVKDIVRDIEIPSNKNVNVLREVVVIRTNNEPILSQAPEREENYFVVPMIIKK